MSTSPPTALNLYICHRSGRSDSPALDLVAALEGLSRGRLVAHCSANFEFGRTWHADTARALDSADVMLLLLGSKDLDWDWWLCEVGYFSARHPGAPVLCLHRPGIQIPAPLQAWNPGPADQARVHSLLRDLLVEPPHRLRPDILEPDKAPVLKMLTGMILRCCAASQSAVQDESSRPA
ncbi:MAG: hypothetical protein U0573_05995 [Phycisphaerales bacterium]|nr:hypothetical protein [Planctomycetota bacterium]